MSDQFWLTPAQLNRIKPHFPLSHGVPRVDDLRVISGIKRGLQLMTMSSSEVCNGGTRLRTTALTRHSITALCGGAVWAFSTKYSRTLRQVKASPNSSRLTRPTSKATAPQPACLKRGCSPSYRTDERRPELKTPRCLRWHGPTRRHAVVGRADE